VVLLQFLSHTPTQLLHYFPILLPVRKHRVSKCAFTVMMTISTIPSAYKSVKCCFCFRPKFLLFVSCIQCRCKSFLTLQPQKARILESNTKVTLHRMFYCTWATLKTFSKRPLDLNEIPYYIFCVSLYDKTMRDGGEVTGTVGLR
jgi:hypothetical protein